MQQFTASMLTVGNPQSGLESQPLGNSQDFTATSESNFNQFYQDAQRKQGKPEPERQIHAESKQEQRIDKNADSKLKDENQSAVRNEKKLDANDAENVSEQEHGEQKDDYWQNDRAEKVAAESSEKLGEDNQSAELAENADDKNPLNGEELADSELLSFIENLSAQRDAIKDQTAIDLESRSEGQLGKDEIEQSSDFIDQLLANSEISVELKAILAKLSPEQLEKLEQALTELKQLFTANGDVSGAFAANGVGFDSLKSKLGEIANQLAKLGDLTATQKIGGDLEQIGAQLKMKLQSLDLAENAQLSNEELTEFLKSLPAIQGLFAANGDMDKQHSVLTAELLKEESGKDSKSGFAKLQLSDDFNPSDKLSLLSKLLNNETEKSAHQINSQLASLKTVTSSDNSLVSETNITAGIDSAQITRINSGAIETSGALKSVGAPININKPEFQMALSERIQVMVNGRVQVADIRLDPPDLGSMQIRINMNNDQAAVSIVVQSQQTKDALDQAIPRLKELLAEQGITLGESTVQKDSNSNENPEQRDSDGLLADHQLTENENQNGEVLSARVVNGVIGGIDFYA